MAATWGNLALDTTSEWTRRTALGASGAYHFSRQFGRDSVKLLPGEFEVTAEDVVLTTTLGSCVAACIRDTATGVGGMNHFMLPEAELDTSRSSSARYGSYAMEVLINELLKRGGSRRNLEAKVFGGGNVLRSITSSDVGQRNAEFVRHYLAFEGIAIAAEDLGGTQARKVAYFPRSGRVLVKLLPPALSGAELAQESEYRKSLRSKPVAGEIELFDTP